MKLSVNVLGVIDRPLKLTESGVLCEDGFHVGHFEDKMLN